MNNANKFAEYFEILALCHDIIVEKEKGEPSYSSSSPDEIALVNFAKFCGYEYLGEENDRMAVYSRSEDRIKRYVSLAHLEFTSDRKRMSVLVQN